MYRLRFSQYVIDFKVNSIHAHKLLVLLPALYTLRHIYPTAATHCRVCATTLTFANCKLTAHLRAVPAWCLSAWRVRLLWQAAATCNTRAEIERQSNGDAADDCETAQLRMRLGRARAQTPARAWPGQHAA